MSKRILPIAFFLFIAGAVHAQTFSGWSNNYVTVHSYDGVVSMDAHRVRFQYTGTSMNVPNWKVSVKLRGPILSGDGKVFPSEKISLAPVRTEGQANHPGPLPTVSQIGMPSPVPLKDGMEVFLVPSSNAPLYHASPNNAYYDLQMVFNLVVAGGAYLKELQDYRQFIVPFQFTAYRSDNTVIGVYPINYTIQVNPLTGTPPPDESQYAIRVSTEASNGLLEFNTVSDYTNGKNVSYTNGLAVTANTAYQVTVRSIPSQFSSATGNTLPLDVVRLQLSGGGGTLPLVTLSTDAKAILHGNSTNGVATYFDITYSTRANDSRLFNVATDLYSTSLLYEISPR